MRVDEISKSTVTPTRHGGTSTMKGDGKEEKPMMKIERVKENYKSRGSGQPKGIPVRRR